MDLLFAPPFMGGQEFTFACRLFFCTSANFCVFVYTMLSFTLSSGKVATDPSGGGYAAPSNQLASMSPGAMRELLMQQQSALASLQSKIDEMPIQEKAGVPDLTLAAIKEVLDKPKMAS